MNTALTIAGSDSCGGAGIQADIKTMTVHNVYAMSAVTALTAQNTIGVKSISEVTPSFLADQLDCVFSDITPDAVKIGMLSSKELVETVSKKLAEYNAKNIVLDPVMIATSGASLSNKSAVDALKKCLLPKCLVVTPNLFEAQILSDMRITSSGDMERAAEIIFNTYGCAVLIKGGHSKEDANDFLYQKNDRKWFFGKRINNPNTHGTGCTLSSAVCSNLANGFNLEAAVDKAKRFLTAALQTDLNLGRGSGPICHTVAIKK